MKDLFNRQWIMENALAEISNYDKGVLTLRALHYRLVSRGMTNSINHYKRVVNAMGQARWDGIVDFETFSDHDRDVLGFTYYNETDVDSQQRVAERQIKNWMAHYSKNRWENQDYYLEIWIEKKALQGVFEPICNDMDVACAPCKGYPSLTFLYEAAERFKIADFTHIPKILYFGDYDPSGEDIPRAIRENLERLGINVEIDRILLLENQVLAMGLPPAPVKLTDTRTANWDGLGQVELDAVEPTLLQNYIREAIERHFDRDKYEDLLELEEQETEIFRANLKEYVKTL